MAVGGEAPGSVKISLLVCLSLANMHFAGESVRAGGGGGGGGGGCTTQLM